jgi:RNA polymerase sigma-70 factor (ECF subfamily)
VIRKVPAVDLEVIERAQRGDREAFGHVAHAYGDALFALAERILRDADRADDALQQTLVSAWQELPRLREPERIEAWLRRILVRACYSETRRTSRWAMVLRPLDVDLGGEDAGERTVDDRDLLERGFRRLPTDQRAILAMHHYLGLSPAEIAETLGIPPVTARSRLHRAHRAMRAALDADERSVVAGGPIR